MKVLVTGGTGFVGQATVDALASAGHAVRMAVRVARPVLSGETVVTGEIGPGTDWGRALDGVDAVVHLAGRAHILRDVDGGARQFHVVNTEGTLKFAEDSAAAGVRRFVFASTVKVNGESTSGRPFSADDEPRPVGPYSQSKFEAERGLRQIGGLDWGFVRPLLVYGPGAKGNLARMCRLAMSGLPVPFAGIDNRRDLVGVRNLASLIVRCVTHAAAPRQVYLASDSEPLSTGQLYRMICASLGRPARMFAVPVGLMHLAGRVAGLSGEVHRLTQSLELDIEKTKDQLGWQPPVATVDGVAEMARAFRLGTP